MKVEELLVSLAPYSCSMRIETRRSFVFVWVLSPSWNRVPVFVFV